MKITHINGIISLLFGSLVTIIWGSIPHAFGATPLLALAIRKEKRSLLQLAAFVPALAHDLYHGFHATSPWVYISLVTIACISTYSKNVGIQALGASITFFTLTNFGVWYSTRLYPLSWAGLTTCYWAALPFASNLLLSTILFAYSIEYLTNRQSYLTIKKAFCTITPKLLIKENKDQK